ncbi:zinc finger BED domain-containing protein RICESLEEPER [Trifolium repens]|nr:zinc finger BED domain-containing protein RICESLEEPER [Trifolium repens]
MAEETHTGVEQMDTDGAENSNQGGQPPIFTTQESQPPTAESQGIQPLIATESTPIATENTTTADPAALPPQPSKKRKPNASGPRKTSPAWDHFTKLPDSEVANPTAACNYCGKRYLCDTKSHGTTNMLAHSKICPKNPYVLSNDPNQTVLTLGPNGAGGLELGAASHRFNVEFCRRALAKFVILDEQPFRVVEGEGFRNLLRTLQPQFVVPSRHTIPRDCFKLYQEEKTSLRALLRSNCTRVALTTDCWTSVQNLGYLVLTDVAENLLAKIKGNLSKMYDWYARNHGQQNRVNPSSSVSVSVQQPTQLNKPNAFKSYLKEINSIGNKNELEKYLAEDNVDEDDNFNLLLWWKQNCARFPVLSRMARDVFATPVSTVASESAFSTGGRVLDTFRSCLNPEMAEALICTQNWLRAPSFSQPEGQNTQEELETSERIVRELCQSLASTTFGGVAGPSASTSSAGASSSQSRPPGCG